MGVGDGVGVGVGDGVGVGVGEVKVAETDLSAFISTSQLGFVPVQSPPQPVKIASVVPCAVRCAVAKPPTGGGYSAWHVGGHEMRPVSSVTDPPPVTVTVRIGFTPLILFAGVAARPVVWKPRLRATPIAHARASQGSSARGLTDLVPCGRTSSP